MPLRVFLLLFPLFISLTSKAESPRCEGVFFFRQEEKLSQIKDLPRGNGIAFLGSQKVFLKKLKGGSESEVFWLQKLNSLGLGVKLFEIAQINGQNFAVIEYFEGINTQIAMMAPEGFILRKEAVAKIRAQARTLAENGIIPVDLQFQVSLDGKDVRLIDPELFQQATTPQEALQKTENILRNLLLPWSMEGRIEL